MRGADQPNLHLYLKNASKQEVSSLLSGKLKDKQLQQDLWAPAEKPVTDCSRFERAEQLNVQKLDQSLQRSPVDIMTVRLCLCASLLAAQEKPACRGPVEVCYLLMLPPADG